MTTVNQGSSPAAIPTEGALESGDAFAGPVQMVAIRYGDRVVTAPMPGFRHHHILTVAAQLGFRQPRNPEDQGFATKDGRFLTRKEAAAMALASGQVAKLIAPPDLYSEDCW